MFRFGVAALAVLLSGSVALSQDSLLETLLSQERKLVEAIKQKDKRTLKEMLRDQAYAITPAGGRQTAAQMLRSLEDVSVASYSLREAKVVKVSKDVGILTYKYTWSGSRNGVNIPATTVFATSTWALRDGTWRPVFYQETPVKK